MKIPTVSKFLWYFDLTTGGLLLGYIGAVTNAGCALALIYEFVAENEEFEEEIFEFSKDVPIGVVIEEAIGHKPRNKKEFPAWAILFVAVFWIGLLILCSIFSIWFIQGVNNRDPKKVRYFLIIMAFGTCSSFMKGIFSLSFWWILLGMANVYFLICLYSLYELLQYEEVEQAKSHVNAGREGYAQCCDSELYQGDEEGGVGGYQTSEFNEP